MYHPNNPAHRSFISYGADHPFPIQNLPFGIFSHSSHAQPRVGVAIGDHIIDLSVLADAGLLDGTSTKVFHQHTLNAFVRCKKPFWQATRTAISKLLHSETATLRDNAALRAACLFERSACTMFLPMEIGDYTDFYSSREHATNVGIMFRGKDNALQPNWLHLPVGYHGRASTVVLSGTDLHRPMGQTKLDSEEMPSFGPSRLIDFELEVGFFVDDANALGERIDISKAEEHIFGLVLVNDWSARDIQKWEYVPLGPFLAKNFGTSISPWVVSLEALEPFRVAGPTQTEPAVLPYLQQTGAHAFDIALEVWLAPHENGQENVISRSNFKHLYWSMAQQLTHHAVTGCQMRAGDLLASGTISGPSPDSFGSLLELTWRGERPLALKGGIERKFLQDGDRITMTGFAQGEGYRVGFGEVTGKVLPVRK